MPEPRKDKKIIFWAKGKRGHTAQGPSTCENTDRVSSLTALGVIINDKLTAANHVSSIVLRVSDYCVQYAYCTAIQYQQRNCKMFLDQLYWPNCCTVRQHGLRSAQQQTVRGLKHSRIFISYSFIRRCQRLGYCSSDTPTLSEMFDDADEQLFTCILNN